MNPIAFTVFGLEIRWYGILISTGILLALLLGEKRSKIYELDFDKVLDVFLVALPCAIIGARFYYVIFNWSSYQGNLYNMINIREGGLAIHGGILAAILASYFMCKVKKIPFKSGLDLAAPCIILGQSIGRWGNFFNSEAHGGEVTKQFISYFPDFIQKGMLIDGVYYNPTFFYESIWDLCIFFLLLKLTKKEKPYKGVLFCYYVLLYSIGRFFIEGLRTDSLMLGNLRAAQILGIFLILISIFCIIKIKFINKRAEKFN